MSLTYRWTRITNYRPACLPVPKDTAWNAMNRAYAVRRWVRGHAMQLVYGVLIAAGLAIGGLIPWGM